jgi:hypothetical protein
MGASVLNKPQKCGRYKTQVAGWNFAGWEFCRLEFFRLPGTLQVDDANLIPTCNLRFVPAE